jgi:flagellar motor switch protein FliN/FliY
MAEQQPPESQPPAELAQVLGSAVDQASIDELLRQSDFPPSDSSPDPAAPPSEVSSSTGGDAGELADQASIDELLRQASFEDPSAMSFGAGSVAAPDASEFKLPNFQQVMQDAQASSIDLLRDVELNVKIELGRARMLVEDVLKLVEGSVVELDKLAGDPVDVFVNDRLVARGEVLVLNDNFCVRVNEIVSGVKDEGA